MNELPCQFYAKTWTFLAMVLIFGMLACFGCIMGPLFLFDIIKSANGKPGYEAGIPLTIISYLFMLPYFILFLYHLLAFQKPVISLFKEGIEIRVTTSYSWAGIPFDILGIGFILTPLAVILRLATFRKLIGVTTDRILWQEIETIEASRFDLHIKWQMHDPDEKYQDTNSISFDRNAFESPQKVALILKQHYYNLTLRNQLPSWENSL